MTHHIATFAGGCFWCMEAVFQRIRGVVSIRSGFMGGDLPNPSYKKVCEETTGHAEVIQITFDPSEITYDQLLEVFWIAHDPTTLNRQGHDIGTRYRSEIFYHTEDQRLQAIASRERQASQYSNPIVTQITAASEFYSAEDYHQNYFNLNSNQPYCHYVIKPKLDKLGLTRPPG